MIQIPEIKEDILYVFPYGSRVYGTNTEKSDYDYIIIVDVNKDLKYDFENEKGNYIVYSDKTFRTLIERHDIAALECIFSNETNYEFILNLDRLRRAISAVASNSFVKCKKKLMPGKDYNPYIGKKSLFHSVRILMFGIQIAKYCKIVNFQEANIYFDDIMSTDQWEVLKERYQPIGNKLKSEFKRVAPIDKDTRDKKW